MNADQTGRAADSFLRIRSYPLDPRSKWLASLRPFKVSHKVAAKLTFRRVILKIASLRLLPCASPIFGEGKGTMKPEIHPSYNEISVVCACGHTFKTRSTLGEDLHVEICSDCHPFFTGKQKLVDTAGRVDRFNKRYQRGAAAEAAK